MLRAFKEAAGYWGVHRFSRTNGAGPLEIGN